MTKDEANFLDQYARKLMVDLCHSQIVHGDPFVGLGTKRLETDKVFIEYAKKKKWLSSKGDRVIGGGWRTAASFLKR